MLLVSLLFEFVAATVVATVIAAVVIAVIVAIIVPRLEFLVVPFIVVITVIAKRITPVVPVAFPAFIGSETLDKRRIGELQLPCREAGELLLNSVVMDGLFMPVIIGQFHVIGHCIGETVALVGIFFGQRLVDHDLQVFAQMREFGVTLGVFEWLWTRPQCFPGRDGIGRSHFQLEIGDQKEMIP